MTLAYLQVLSLVLPISPAELLPLVALGLAGWVANGAPIVARVHGARLRGGRWPVVLVVGLWAAIYAQAPISLYDAGLYHLSSIRWASAFRVTPGLGNLSPPLGVNSSVFLYIAASRAGSLPGFHIALGLPILVLLLELVWMARLPVGKLGQATEARPSAYVAALLVLPTLVLAGQAGFSTTLYDAPIYLLSIVMATRLLDLPDRPTRPEALLTVFCIALLGFTAMTVKISIAFFSVACLAVAAAAAIRAAPPRLAELASILAIVAGLGVVVLGPWLVRNAILTGYLLYPDPTVGLPFDWSMPRSAVQDYRDVLYDFARVRGPDYHGASRALGWFTPWLAMSWRDSIAPLFIAVAAPIAILLVSPERARSIGRHWLLLVPVWLALILWFVTAPDPRYAGSLLWLAAAIPVAFWLPSLGPLARVLVLVLFCAAVEMPNGSYLIGLAQVPAGVVTGQFADLEDPPVEPLWVFTTRSGLQVYVPVEGDQVWDATLPATPYPDPDLRLRCPQSLACGFAVVS